MSTLLIVNRSEDWLQELPGVEVVPARTYLTDPAFSNRRGDKVFNLCRSYRYQSLGYYVSLLAAARGHRPMPSVATIQDLKSRTLIRFVSEDLEELIGKSLSSLASDEFTLSIYFGRNLAQRHRRLALHLFNAFPAPLLRARFTRRDKWELTSLKPISFSDVAAEHRPFVLQAAAEHFAGRRLALPRRTATRFDLAILVDPNEATPPSDERAIAKFVKAGQALELAVDVIEPDDLGRLAEYDALFLRETTQVDHHTYRFARRAEAEGLVVIDDPDSILRCTNKVYLAERLTRARIPTPPTLVVHRDNLEAVADELGFPCIVKLPESSFSLGVYRIDDAEAYARVAAELLEESDLFIAQAFVPTEFDWRIGVLDRRFLYACRYWMATGHWQIVKRDQRGRSRYGRAEAVPEAEVPPQVLATAVRAANLIGDGLYGVDVKEIDGKPQVIEVNDNPSIEAGIEDGVIGDALYERVMEVFLARIERTKAPSQEAAP